MKETSRRWLGFRLRPMILESSWLVYYDLEPGDEGYTEKYIRVKTLVEIKYVDMRCPPKHVAWNQIVIFNMIAQGWKVLADLFEIEDRPGPESFQ